jgi:hypothetical protein
MAWLITGDKIGMQPITERSTTQNHKLGLEVEATDGSFGQGAFMYVKGVASAENNEWCTFDLHAGAIVRAAANAKGTVGITKATLTASYYGWIAIKGVHTGQCLTAFADNGKVFLTGTSGAVDDASVAGDLISGAVGRALTVADSGVTVFELNRPFVTDADS